jgi:hypothetical protein
MTRQNLGFDYTAVESRDLSYEPSPTIFDSEDLHSTICPNQQDVHPGSRGFGGQSRERIKAAE